MTARKPSRRTPAPAPEPVVVPPSAQPVTTEITKDAAATRSTEAAAPASDTPPPVKRARTKRDTTATSATPATRATAAGAKPAGAKGGTAETKAASPKPVRTKAVRAKATEATAVRTDVAGTESARAEAADAGSTGTGSTGTGSTGARSTGAGSSRAEAPAPLQAANVSEAAGSGPGGDGPVPGAAASTPGAASAVDRAPSPADATANGAPPRPRRGGGSKDALPATALDDADRWRLLAGEHHAPHDVLGAHPASGGVAVRVLRPFAHAVTVLTGGLRAELQSDGDGLFSGVLPMPEVPDAYRLLITYDDGESEAEDPYRFLPTLGELDLHLIGEGRHEELWKALGAQPMERQGVAGTRFTVWAPDARGVRVAGDFNFWDGTGFPMRSLGSTGVWELFLPGVGEGARYKYDICRPDGSHTLRADPMARQAEVPPATASVVTASHHVWQDADWMAHRGDRPVHEAPFSVYEVHLPSWRPGLGYRQLAAQLPAYVSELGFTHVELMPVSEHPFGGSWGYQVTGFYAPTSRLGSPDDFRFLVDSLHAAGIGVLMDWVPAHFPRDEWALAEFDGRPLYEHPDPSRAAHPDWGTLEFDYGRTEVRNFLVANATYWCEEFHIDGLRVDAVASMLYLDYSREDGQWSPNEFGGRENLDAVAFLQEMNATVYRRNPGVVTIAEESTAWDGVTRPTDQGGLGFGLKWNMGWMHDSLVYVSKEPIHRKYHHHEMTFSMVYAYSENYVLPISHDEVVHGKQALVSKMPGDWWQRRANHRAYLGFMWAHPGKQLLFMGQEFAQGAEWSEGHGPDWWLLDETYEASGDHRGVRSLVTDLNGVYNALPALWQRDTDPGGFSWIDGGAAEDNAFSFVRYDADGSPLIAVSHFSPVVRHDYRIGVPDGAEAWVEVLNTDAARYGGGDIRNEEPLKPEVVPAHGRDTSIALTLPPLATVWLRPA
ncbi:MULTISPECIES: 1,4-alpha-glucan branching enzyme [unclassified Streptomyces]|uniref:1,4-alpha-glucan branching enzyme n=1 Tax=unclassified Streptomyces TaxID=2593676 RepID=UPI0008049BE9|nr:1,4-alpha-glucan branching enzyme [Streptomyces sp. OspMP-M45]SBU96632.1 1,4-alpha-glucan branching enzyme [Streptomyces sp. OspMP-M45]